MIKHETPTPIDADEPLTILDYLHQPIKSLIQHPDFDMHRFIRVYHAINDAMTFIAEHDAELQLILDAQGADPE